MTETIDNWTLLEILTTLDAMQHLPHESKMNAKYDLKQLFDRLSKITNSNWITNVNLVILAKCGVTFMDEIVFRNEDDSIATLDDFIDASKTNSNSKIYVLPKSSTSNTLSVVKYEGPANVWPIFYNNRSYLFFKRNPLFNGSIHFIMNSYGIHALDKPITLTE